jgi:hypothetical protein
MTEEQIAALNLPLQQLGFATLGDYARAFTEGVVGNEQLVEALADRIAVKMTTNAAPATDATTQALKSVRSPGFEPGLQAWRACVLLACLETLDQAGRRPHDRASEPVSF